MPAPDQLEVCTKGTERALIGAYDQIDRLEARVERLEGLLRYVMGNSDETPVAASFFAHPEAARALSELREELRRRGAVEEETT